MTSRDFATLKRMLGIGSAMRESRTWRILSRMTSMDNVGAIVWSQELSNQGQLQVEKTPTVIARTVVIL
jgi:hypothetical protein